ncbi:hypothetical protein [Streptomyces katrae]|uniref:hypothetical protein n=1 Tax=Streptomyces katrae TaxID=68223 RepID=UPI000B17066F|nr:hypothetical protein [Streptomyces katrae]
MRRIAERKHATRAGRTGRLVTAVFASLLALSVGCSNIMELPYTPERMDPDPARAKTREVSGRLLEMAGVKGKVTEPRTGMNFVVCDEYGQDLYALHHRWSVGGMTSDQYEAGMQNLRKALGENGWKISKVSPDEIRATNETEHFFVEVISHTATPEPTLDFSVSSRCYRAASHAAVNEG